MPGRAPVSPSSPRSNISPVDSTGEVLFLDVWTSAEGLNQIFANPTVQEQAGQLFTERDPVVWTPAEGFVPPTTCPSVPRNRSRAGSSRLSPGFEPRATLARGEIVGTGDHLPASYGENDRFIVMVRGTFALRDEARTVHNAIVAQHVGAARLAGDLSHDAYFRVTAPDAPDSLEYLAIDVFKSAEGVQDFFANPDVQSAFAGLFTAPPAVSVWTNAPGDWVEW